MKYEKNFSRKGAKATRRKVSSFASSFAPLRLCGRKTCLALVVLAASALLSACGGTSAAEDKSKIQVGIVFDIGGKDDRSFNAAAWEGVQRAAKDLPIVLARHRTRDTKRHRARDARLCRTQLRSDHRRRLRSSADHGAGRERLSKHSVRDHRRCQQLPNVASLVFKEHEGSYLVGILAAKASKTRARSVFSAAWTSV
jgi:basic membrane protein A